jgi:hypothetical protein
VLVRKKRRGSRNHRLRILLGGFITFFSMMSRRTESRGTWQGSCDGPLAASSGLLVAGGMQPAQAASSASAITIGVKAHMAAVAGDSLVAYRYGKYATAAISGSVSGATSGDVATLLAEPSGTRAFSPTAPRSRSRSPRRATASPSPRLSLPSTKSRSRRAR